MPLTRIASQSDLSPRLRGEVGARSPNPDIPSWRRGQRCRVHHRLRVAHRAVEHALRHQRRLGGGALLVDLDAGVVGVGVLRLGAHGEFGEMACQPQLARRGKRFARPLRQL